MTQVLRIDATGNLGIAVVQFAPARVIQNGDALEFDELISAPTPRPFKHYDHSIYINGLYVSPLDQNGFTQPSDTPDIYPWVSGNWYHRAFDLSAYAGQTLSFVQLGIILQAVVGGTYQHNYREIAITHYREPVQWLWREGMAEPALFLVLNGLEGSASMSLAAIQGTFPEWCINADSTETLVNDLQIDRAIGGNVRGRDYHNRTRRAWKLNIDVMSDLERQSLETFYDVFHTEPFLYRHRGNLNLPAHLAVFNTAPSTTEHPNLLGQYQAQIDLVEV